MLECDHLGCRSRIWLTVPRVKRSLYELPSLCGFIGWLAIGARCSIFIQHDAIGRRLMPTLLDFGWPSSSTMVCRSFPKTVLTQRRLQIRKILLDKLHPWQEIEAYNPVLHQCGDTLRDG